MKKPAKTNKPKEAWHKPNLLEGRITVKDCDCKDLCITIPNNKPNEVKIKKVHPNAILPKYHTKGSVGCDLHYCSHRSISLNPGETHLFKTGLSIALPDGIEAQVRPRSGLAMKQQITVLNAPGTIDVDYRGEIGVLLINLSPVIRVIKPNDRIAQLVFAPFIQANFTVVESLSATERGEGGFGSTGA